MRLNNTALVVLCAISLLAMSACRSGQGVSVAGTSSPTPSVLMGPHYATATLAPTHAHSETSTTVPKPTHTPTPTLTPSRTPTNTSTPTAEPTHVPLPELLGFTDEYIEELEASGAYFLESTETTVDGTRYALFFTYTDYFETVLLAYRFEGGDPVLLLDSRADDLPGKWAIGIISFMEAGEWGDLNQDGRPDLVIEYSYSGTAWSVHHQVHVWQIEPGGEFVDLTALIYEDYRLIPQHVMEDMNNDGILEFWVGDYRGEWYGGGHVAGVASFKIYAWQGDKVYNVSDEFPDLYDERIAKYREFIEGTYAVEMEGTADGILTQAFGLLINYENSGRRDEGWQAYWALTDPEHWPHSSPEFSESITARRELHKAQYEAGELFGK